MTFDTDVVKALGDERALHAYEGAERLVRLANSTPTAADSIMHVPVELRGSIIDAAERDFLAGLKSPIKGGRWNSFLFGSEDGRYFARATDRYRHAAPEDSAEWLITFFLADLHTRLGTWWLTQVWRAADLAAACRKELGEWNVVAAAACGRSLLEGAAYLSLELPTLVELWDSFKRKGYRTAEDVDALVNKFNLQVFSLQHATRLGQMKKTHQGILSRSVLTYIEKLQKRVPDVDVIDIYEWLCDTVHPSRGSALTYCVSTTSDTRGTYRMELFERHPLHAASTIVEESFTNAPVVAWAVADALALAADLLGQDLAEARWILDDITLTAELGSFAELDTPLRLTRPERNATCPCGSGCKFKNCVHRWGASAMRPDPAE